MAGIFKAYDVRGTYPDQIDETMARKIGQAFAHLVADDELGGPIVVSRDMRSHSVPLCEALIDGLRTAEVPCLFLRRGDKRSTLRVIPATIDYLRKLVRFRRRLRDRAT